MGPDDLLISHNARLPKALVGRACMRCGGWPWVVYSSTREQFRTQSDGISGDIDGVT